VAAARHKLTFLRNQLVLLLQTPDPIFEVAVFTLRKQVDYPVSPGCAAHCLRRSCVQVVAYGSDRQRGDASCLGGLPARKPTVLCAGARLTAIGPSPAGSALQAAILSIIYRAVEGSE
jgi:hypothetical protein